MMSTHENKTMTATVWQHCPSKFSATELVLLLKIAGLSTRQGHCYAFVTTLATMCGVKERAIQYALRRLVKSGVLRIQTRKGHSSRYFLQLDEIRKLPLVMPKDAEKPTAEAVKLAEDFEVSIRTNLKRTAPADWRTIWPVELQTLYAQGHTDAEVRAVATYARNHTWWSNELADRGVVGFVRNFSTILEHYQAAQQKVAA